MRFWKQTDFRLWWMGLLLLLIAVVISIFEPTPIGGLWVAAFGLAALFPWFLFGVRYMENCRIDVLDHDPRVQVIEIYRRMTPDQMAFIANARIVADVALGVGRNTETRTLYLRGTVCTYDIAEIQAVWSMADREYMTAVRRFGGDSRLQACCNDLTDYFTLCGILAPAHANQAARWINTLTEFGYDEARKLLKI